MTGRFLPDIARFDSLSIGVFFAALTCLTIALTWLTVLLVISIIKGWRRVRWPLGLLLVGLVVGALPLAWTGLRAQIDLGPLDRMVDGERHLTLTGWDRPATDYHAALATRHDAVVLQMANSDVADVALTDLALMNQLRELDLSDSAVTDASLPIIATLPALKTLKLARTKITDGGFTAHLANKQSLERLDVRATAIEPQTIAAWREVKPERRALGP